MSLGAWYLDTSAVVRLIVAEDHSSALRKWASGVAGRLVSSDLLRTEVVRAVRRPRAGDLPTEVLLLAAREVLAGVHIVPLPTELYAAAGLLDPPALRTLDALHLAAALSLGDDLRGLVTYDERLADAARHNGVAVVTPQ